MMNQLSWRAIALGIFVIFAAGLPLITRNIYYLHVASVMAVYWILIATLNLLVGFTGTLSIGHVGLLALGAYTFCLISGAAGWNPFLGLLAAGGLCAMVGLFLGLPSLRLPGFYFAMVTLAFGFIVTELAFAEQWLTNGSVGMPAPSFPKPFDTPAGFYWLVVGIAGSVTWLSWNLARFMTGRAMIALRDSVVAASSVAIPVYRIKLIVFVLSGFTAGIAGGLFATSESYITPDAFHVHLGMYFFVAIIIGGSGVILGPFIGTVVLAAIPLLVAPLAAYAAFFYGFTLLLVVLILPGGVNELFRAIAVRVSPAPVQPTRVEPDIEKLRVAISEASRS
jgi:branched-chain amino acid transport system permease protein